MARNKVEHKALDLQGSPQESYFSLNPLKCTVSMMQADLNLFSPLFDRSRAKYLHFF